MANHTEVKVPPMGESITEGTIARWFKQVGEPVVADEPLFEIETDKVTQEVPAPASGVLLEIKKQAGETAAIHEAVAVIAGVPQTTPTAIPSPSEHTNRAPAAETLPPAVKKLIAEQNLNPAAIEGSGRHGQITKGDVIAHIEKQAAKTIEKKAETIEKIDKKIDKIEKPEKKELPVSPSERETVVPMSRLRKAIATRLVEAQHTAAILTTFNEVDMKAVIDLRSKYNESFQKKYGVKLGFMSFFVKAVVAALKAIPAVNAEIRGDNIVYKNYYDIGVAVGGPKGLVVPVVRNADQLSFAEIELEIARLSQKVHEGSIALSDLEGGTFTISNGGIYGSMMSTPILNPPQSGILGMHNIVKRPVAIEDQIVIRPMMYLALSYDHRIIDGKEAVTFLLNVKQAIEDPMRLILEI